MRRKAQEKREARRYPTVPGAEERKGRRPSPKPMGGRFTSFTPLTALIDQVLMQIKDEEALTFPGKRSEERRVGKEC